MILALKSKRILPVLALCFSFFFFLLNKIEGNQRERIEKEQVFRVMTYNIHHGEGIDGKADIQRIARMIDQSKADIVLLQEVDVGMERSGRIDIPEKLSELTGLNHYVFGKNLDIDGGEYGNATLSRYPVINHKNVQFEQTGSEQRGILVSVIQIDQTPILILNAHLDPRNNDDSERMIYIERAIKEILPEYDAEAVLFGGDFNDIPGSRMYKQATKFFKDAWNVSGENEGATFPSTDPEKRIDYIFYNGSIKLLNIEVLPTEASDHRPVVAGFIQTNN